MAKTGPQERKHTKEVWKIPPFKVFERQFLIDDYMSSELYFLLHNAYLVMADAFVTAGVRLTPDIVRNILPKHALKLAVALSGADDRPAQRNYIFGSVLISKSDAMRTFAPVISHVSRTANKASVRWKEPTPPQQIDRFLKLKHWTKVTLIKRVSGIDDYVCETTKQFLKRLHRRPQTNLQFGIDSRTLEKLKALRNVIVASAPDEFGDLTLDDLRWTPLDSSE